MQRVIGFFLYNNIVPIVISFAILGAATTYAATNPDKIISKQDQVVSIDNTYIARVDLNNYSPSIKILSVTEDSDAYYVQYIFSTIDLVDSVWRDATTTETLTVDKASLGNYRDLGLFVTKQLTEKIQAEIKRLKATQVIEKKQVTQKTIVTKYKGIVGGFLDEKHTTIAGYVPLIKPPKPPKETQTFARPDPNAPKQKPQEAPVIAEVPPIEATQTLNQDIVPIDSTTTIPEGTDTTSTSTGATSSSTGQTGSSNGTSTNEISNEPPTLAILGDNPVNISVGDAYLDLGAVVTDDHDTGLSVTVLLDGQAVNKVAIDTSIPGQHTIIYDATDTSGAAAQAERVVIVKAKDVVATSTPPTATSSTPVGTSTQSTNDSTGTNTPTSNETTSTPQAAPEVIAPQDPVSTSSATSS